jgi:hypothetical protein
VANRRSPDLSAEYWASTLGGVSLGVLYGANVITAAPLLAAVAGCVAYLTARVMHKVLR